MLDPQMLFQTHGDLARVERKGTSSKPIELERYAAAIEERGPQWSRPAAYQKKKPPQKEPARKTTHAIAWGFLRLILR